MDIQKQEESSRNDILSVLRKDLEKAVALLRSHAATVGTMHVWWDDIFDFEAHLKGEAGWGDKVASSESAEKQMQELWSRAQEAEACAAALEMALKPIADAWDASVRQHATVGGSGAIKLRVSADMIRVAAEATRHNVGAAFYEKVRMLTEALAHIAQNGDEESQGIALQTLKDYNVRLSCVHVEQRGSNLIV